MPDFDIDFCEEKRDQVFEYLKKKYKNILFMHMKIIKSILFNSNAAERPIPEPPPVTKATLITQYLK